MRLTPGTTARLPERLPNYHPIMFRLPLCFLGSLVSLIFGAVLSAQPEDERLLNLSSRGWVGQGDNVFVAGFVVGPGEPKQVMVRAIGPTLADYGLTGALPDPELKLYDAGNNLIASNNDWTTEVGEMFGTVGAFELPGGSRDAAMVVALEPGVYSATPR